MTSSPSFAERVIAWQVRHGRRGLPWQGTRDPYRIWLSEVMLQQTQAATVIPYYRRFLSRFPTLQALASAEEDEVLRLWSGLGYYARGRNLHAAARKVVAQGSFPDCAEEIGRLPGVGRSTAAAIAAFAFGERAAILDGNVKRVLARYFGITGWPGEKSVQNELWKRADRLLPMRGIESYTQGMMDLGATVCTRTPECQLCPVKRGCAARRAGTVSAIPSARPRKRVPQKSVTWLVLRHKQQVLLEKRPAPGIWGGLWSFPEGPGRDIDGYCRRVYRFELETKKRLQVLEHAFTHFRLRIHPLLCEVAGREAPARASGHLWINLQDAAGAALPAPVKKLVARLAS